MIREILFRGKRLDNGEWETGSFVAVRDGIFEAAYFIADKMTGYNTQIDPSTVGQYTGLTDRNGKRIWEGDIVKKRTYNGKKPFPVKYDGGMFYAGMGGGSSAATHRYTLEDKQIEVIGNIYDNPELITK